MTVFPWERPVSQELEALWRFTGVTDHHPPADLKALVNHPLRRGTASLGLRASQETMWYSYNGPGFSLDPQSLLILGLVTKLPRSLLLIYIMTL